jgi:hypothetical protein
MESLGEAEMTARYWLTVTVALCAAFAVTAAEAKTRATATPVYRGCSHFIAPLCMGLTSRGKTYVLVGALPLVPPGTGVDVFGTVTGPSPCGTQIQVTSWRQNAKLRCTP